MKILNSVIQNWFPTLFTENDFGRITTACELINQDVPAVADKDFLIANIGEAEIALTSWDTARFDKDVLEAAPNLRLVVHAAGSIKPIISSAAWQKGSPEADSNLFWDKGIRAVSLASAISYGVAEHCLGCILTVSKRLFWTSESIRAGGWKDALEVYGGGFDIYEQNIGIIGAGHVGRHLVTLLKAFHCNVIVYDPYLPDEAVKELGVTKAETLADIFSKCKVVVLSAAGTDSSRHTIKQSHFAMLPEGALFVNVSRGGIFDENELVAELAKERFVACVDVSDVEPPPADHPYRSAPNLLFTPHVAGGVMENRLRIGKMAADDIIAFTRGEPLKNEVTREMMARIA